MDKSDNGNIVPFPVKDGDDSYYCQLVPFHIGEIVPAFIGNRDLPQEHVINYGIPLPDPKGDRDFDAIEGHGWSAQCRVGRGPITVIDDLDTGAGHQEWRNQPIVVLATALVFYSVADARRFAEEHSLVYGESTYKFVC